MKKLLSILCAVAIVLSGIGISNLIIPTTAVTAPTIISSEKPEFSSGFKALDDLDDEALAVTDLFAPNGLAGRTSNGKITSISMNAQKEYLYGESGRSLKIDYDFSKIRGSMVEYTSSLAAKAENKNYCLAFWAYSSQELGLKLQFKDANGTTLSSESFTLATGANIVILPWGSFSASSSEYTPDYSAFVEPQFNLEKTAASLDEGTLYIDKLGVYPEMPKETDPNKDNVKFERNFSEKDNLDKTDKAVTDLVYANGINSVSNGKVTAISMNEDVNYLYGNSGRSLKMDYDFSLGGEAMVRYRYNLAAEKGNPDYRLSFWVYSTQEVKMYVRVLDTSNTDTNQFTLSEEFTVKKGASIITLSWADFTPRTADKYTENYGYFGMPNFYIVKRDGMESTGTVYIDSLGVYPGEPSSEVPEIPEIKAFHEDGFNLQQDMEAFEDITVKVGNSGRWHNLSYPNRFSLSLGQNENAYGGAGKSAAVSYKGLSVFGTATYVTYSTTFTNCDSDGVPLGKDGIFAFWIKADQPLKIMVSSDDSYNEGKHRNQRVYSNWITVPAGESIVKIPMTEFKPSDTAEGYQQKLEFLYGMMLYVSPVDKATCISDGTFYIDSVGFYGTAEKIELPQAHAANFSEKLDMEGFAGDPTVEKGDSGRWSNSAYPKYFKITEGSGENSYGENGKSVAIDYNTISKYGQSCWVSYSTYLHNRNSTNQLLDDSSEIAFWVKTTQNIKIRVAFDDTYDQGKDLNQRLNSEWYIVPKGSGIVTIPWSALTPAEPAKYQAKREWLYSIRFYIAAADTSKCEDTGTVWIDSIGFNCNNTVAGEKISYDNSYILTGFDNLKTDKSLKNLWDVRWAGVGNAGGKVSLDNTTSYGGKGASMKYEYNRDLTSQKICSVMYNYKIHCAGDGIIFWIKSNENTKISIVALDKNVLTISTDEIQIFRGENLVAVKWSDFKYTSKEQAGQKPNMLSVNQFQIRLKGVKQGTVWIDEIGFLNMQGTPQSINKLYNPPSSFSGLYDGTELVADDFNKYPGDDDERFCIDWYYSNYDSTLSLIPDAGGGKMIKYDFDYSSSGSADLINITKYDVVDGQGGIRFKAKMSDERIFGVRLCINNQWYQVFLRGSKTEKVYEIPFSALWLNTDINSLYTCKNPATYSVTQLRFMFSCEISPEKLTPDTKGTLWLDDIAFVDSENMVRSSDIDAYENGVRVIAESTAFSSGVTIKVEDTDINSGDWKQNLKGRVARMVTISANTVTGRNIAPSAQIKVIFDIPEGFKPETTAVYQADLDGSVSEKKVTVEDGKLCMPCYRLGSFILCEKETEKLQTQTDGKDSKGGFPILPAALGGGAAVVIAAGAVAAVIYFKKRRKA